MWEAEADWGTFGRAPVDVCTAAEVTVLVGAVTVPVLLRKCLKEKEDEDEEAAPDPAPVDVEARMLE